MNSIHKCVETGVYTYLCLYIKDYLAKMKKVKLNLSQEHMDW